ncbi:MAG: putative lyase [Caulobacter sp.]|nr:putative lyase [Caulobacter sp.]
MIGRCLCGGVSVTVEGPPRYVTACCCSLCQRRSGSPFSHIGRWSREAVSVEGERRVFERPGESGGLARHSFCPVCASTVLTEVDAMPELLGVPAGLFADPDFPAPAVAAWCEAKAAWVHFPDATLALERQTMPPRG